MRTIISSVEIHNKWCNDVVENAASARDFDRYSLNKHGVKYLMAAGLYEIHDEKKYVEFLLTL